MKKQVNTFRTKTVCSLLLIALALVVGITAAIFGGSAPTVKAEEPTLETAVNLDNMYALGTEFTVPKTNIVDGGNTYPATAIVRYPDGNAYSGERVTLNIAGKYVLEYRAETESGMVSVKKEFSVSEYLYNVSGKYSTASYGTVENAEERPGIATELVYGERLMFNNVINLKGYTKNDKIAEVFVNPVKQGQCDALNIVFVLTDAYDSENYITIMGKRLDRDPLTANWVEKSSYTTANAVGQPATGLENNPSKADFEYEGTKYCLHQNDMYGAGIAFSMAGIPNVNGDCSDIGQPTDIATQSFSISMDYEARKIYANGIIVTDLDDITMFKSVQWNGFTNNECLLSIYATSYKQDEFRFVCTEIDGITGDMLEAGLVVDNKAPVLTLDNGEYTDGFPNAIVGKPYRIPAVTAYDDTDKSVPVKARVYSNYGNKAQINVDLIGGAFTPERAGDYTVIYSASDKFGNSETLRHDITAVVDETRLSIEFGEHTLNGFAGQSVTVAVPQVNNAHGKPAVKITAKFAGENIATEIATSGENAYVFRPMYAGEWQIEYTYSDYIEQKTESYVLVVSPSDMPYIAEEVVLPKYIIKGAIYSVPELNGITFDTGKPIETKTEVYLKQDDGEERKLSGARFTSYANRKTTLIYRLGSGDNTVEKTYECATVDVGYDKLNLRIKDYFVGENFTSEAFNDRISVTTQEVGSQSFEFINALQTFDFRTVFRISASANKFNTLNIYLTDYADPTVTVKVTYRRYRAGNTVFTVNDGEQEYVSTGDFIESSSDSFRLIYNNATRRISPSADFGVEVKTDLSGKPFGGFTGGMAYMRVEIPDATGTAGIEFMSINNQPMSRVAIDLLRPELSAAPVRGERYVGDSITLDAVYAADVLDPDVRFTMSVTTPDGQYVTASDGTVLSRSANPSKAYTFVLDKIGSYTVLYECYDSMDNKTVYSYVINVVDIEAPHIALGGHATEANVGDTVVVATADVTDNVTQECTLQIKVKLPNGSFVTLAGNSFKAVAAGTYTVYYFAYDENFNTASVNYEINVK